MPILDKTTNFCHKKFTIENHNHKCNFSEKIFHNNLDNFMKIEYIYTTLHL